MTFEPEQQPEESGYTSSGGWEPTSSETDHSAPDSTDNWEVPVTTEPVPDADSTHATPPDASPLTDDGFDTPVAGDSH